VLPLTPCGDPTKNGRYLPSTRIRSVRHN